MREPIGNVAIGPIPYYHLYVTSSITSKYYYIPKIEPMIFISIISYSRKTYRRV